MSEPATQSTTGSLPVRRAGTAPDPTWSVTDGDDLAVLGAHLAVLLPGHERERAARLWALLDAGAGLAEVLDALLVGGLASLSDVVVLVRDAPDRVTTLVRGSRLSVAVTLVGDTAGVERDDLVVVDGTTARTWAERSFEDVVSVAVLAGPDRPGAVPVRMSAGLVRAARVEALPAAHDEAPSGAPSASPSRATPRGPAEPPQPTTPPCRPAGDAPLPGPLPGPVPGPAPGEARGDVRGSATGERPVAVLAFSDGTRVDVDEVVLVGRAPAPRGLPAPRPPRLVLVASPQLEVSATHLEVRPGTGPDAGAAVLTDLGSTNGTVLIGPGRRPEDLVAGIGVRAEPGTMVHLGDGVSFEVLRP